MSHIGRRTQSESYNASAIKSTEILVTSRREYAKIHLEAVNTVKYIEQ